MVANQRLFQLNASSRADIGDPEGGRGRPMGHMSSFNLPGSRPPKEGILLTRDVQSSQRGVVSRELPAGEVGACCAVGGGGCGNGIEEEGGEGGGGELELHFCCSEGGYWGGDILLYTR